MKRKSILIGIICSWILLFFACEKDSQNLPSEKISFENPLEIVGIMHNEALTQVEKANAKDLKTAFQIIIDYYSTFNDTTTYTNVDSLLYITSLGFYDVSLDSVCLYYKNAGYLNNIQYSYCLSLYSAVEFSKTFDDFISNVKEIEIKLYNEKELSEEEKDVLWGALSIAKYSGTYWHNYRKGEKAPEPVYTGTWIGETSADVAGWFLGFCEPSGSQRWRPFRRASQTSASASERYVIAHWVIIE